jgi:hypothetical protein
MRRVLITIAAAALVACGGSSGSSGSNGSNSVTVTGSITGALASTTGISTSGSCSIGGTTASLAVAGINFSTATGVCQAAQQGRDVAGATAVFIAVIKGNASGQSVAVAPGTYTITSNPQPDAQGNITFATAGVSRSGSTQNSSGSGCSTAAESSATSGTITISSITSSSIAGSVDVTLDNGGKVQGSFDASVCQISGLHLDSSCDIALTRTCS